MSREGKVVCFSILIYFHRTKINIGRVENFLAENHTLLSDLLRLCKMFNSFSRNGMISFAHISYFVVFVCF